MTDTIERRVAIECRLAGPASARKLAGYAAVFGQEADIGGVFQETIRRGAFARTLAGGGDVVGLVDHDPGQLLGRTRTRTLRLAEDDRGLSFELDVPDTSLGRDVLALAERGDMGGASFAFTVPKGGERWAGAKRELIDVDLAESRSCTRGRHTRGHRSPRGRGRCSARAVRQRPPTPASCANVGGLSDGHPPPHCRSL